MGNNSMVTSLAPQVDETRLQSLITDAQAAIPGLGNRAEKAAELFNSVLYLGDQSGIDWWQVDGNKRVSLRGKSCTCQDSRLQAPAHDKGGKYIGPVCKHRLAVMFVKKVRGANQSALAAILAQMKSAGGYGRLYVWVSYTGKGIADDWKLKGFFAEGTGRVEFGQMPGDWLDIGPDELVEALIQTGLRVTSKAKGSSYNYIWHIGQAVPEDANDAIRLGVLNSMDRETVEKREREAFLANRMKAEAMSGALAQGGA